MRMLYPVLTLLAVFATEGSPRGADKSEVENHLAVLDRFVGEWTVDGKWSSGQSLHARGVYEWGLGKKILKAKTFVINGAKEYQRYESILAWHPEKKSLFEITFAFDGGLSEVLIETKDKDTLQIGWTPYTEGKPSKVRQTIRFLDDDRFQWIALLKDGEEWKQIIDATWKRKQK